MKFLLGVLYEWKLYPQLKMNSYVFLLLSAVFVCVTYAAAISEDAILTVPELIAKHGYPVEVHHVTTVDGYVLEMHRIPYGRAEAAGPALEKQPVFLFHGLFTSSAVWVLSGPTRGLGFLLADMGYDVWMGNARGNLYSRQHISLSPTNAKFWDFSFHEIGIYDLPAMIDYTLEHTEQTRLFYIGHGQGATAFYVMASERPQYNDKIRAQFSLAPVAYMKHVHMPLLDIIGVSHLQEFMGMDEFLPTSEFLSQIANLTTCTNNSVTDILCSNILFLIFGYNLEQLDMELLPVIMGHTPAGGSTKQLLHYAQLIRSGRFRQYDYGILNIIKYKSIVPPNYNLTRVSAPAALFYSQNDVVTPVPDVVRLYFELANPIGKFQVVDSKFSHLDFLWGKDVVTLVYNKIFSIMTHY